MSQTEVDKLLKVHRNGSQLDFKEIWEKGLFFFDANVLLDLYRLPKSARDDLMGILKNPKFNSRLWLGFQVALEFLNNRFDAISDQKQKFSTVEKLVQDAINSYKEASTTLQAELSKLKLKQRHSVIDPDQFITTEKISASFSYLSEFLRELGRLNVDHADVQDHDKIKDFVFTTFEGRIGTSLEESTLTSLYKEGEARYESGIPPGYKDKAKEGCYNFNGKSYIRKFGDLILWKEIIAKAAADHLKYVVLVTGDVKEDWWSERRGKRLGPRKELLEEIYSAAPTVEVFHMYDTSTFLQYAKNHLDSKIKDSSIDEAKDLIALSRFDRNETPAQLLSISSALEQIAARTPDLNTSISQNVFDLPPVMVDTPKFVDALHEIVLNAMHHSNDQYLTVDATKIKSHIRLRFKNRKSPNRPVDGRWAKFYSIYSNHRNRNFGLRTVTEALEAHGIATQFTDTGGKFMADLFIPNDLFGIFVNDL